MSVTTLGETVTRRVRREEAVLRVWGQVRQQYRGLEEFLRAAARPWSEEARLLGEALGYTGKRAYVAGMVAARATLRTIRSLRFVVGAEPAAEKLLLAVNEVLRVGDTAAKLLGVKPGEMVTRYFANPAFRARAESVLRKLVAESPLLSKVRPSPGLVVSAYAQLLPARHKIRAALKMLPGVLAGRAAASTQHVLGSIALQFPVSVLSLVARMVPGGETVAWGLSSLVFEARRAIEEAVRWRMAATRGAAE